MANNEIDLGEPDDDDFQFEDDNEDEEYEDDDWEEDDEDDYDSVEQDVAHDCTGWSRPKLLS